MKSSTRNIETELFGGQGSYSEDTNPFQKSQAFGATQKAGKRPRIMKPLYSVRLS